MAESFGSAFTIVEVTADDWSGGRPRKEFWVAAAKPSQALTLVLAAVPEGWTAELVTDRVTQQQQRSLEKLNLKPVVSLIGPILRPIELTKGATMREVPMSA